MNKLNKVFVYGTLKVGGFYASSFDNVRISHKRATIKGTMLSIGHFPGVVLQSNNTVIGEIHEYDDFDNVLFSLDQIEGCSGKEGKKSDLYHREIIMVDTDHGEERAWIYTFNIDESDMLKYYDIVETGEWKINQEMSA